MGLKGGQGHSLSPNLHFSSGTRRLECSGDAGGGVGKEGGAACDSGHDTRKHKKKKVTLKRLIVAWRLRKVKDKNKCTIN